MDLFLQNICVHCKDVSLPKMPSDWFNKELNDQGLGRSGQAVFPDRERTLGRRKELPGKHRGNRMDSTEMR